MPVQAPGPDAGRSRLRLRVAAKLMLGCAVLAVLFVFVSAFLSGDKPGNPTPGMRVDITDMAPGTTRTVLWQGRPVLVQHRTPGIIAALQRDESAHAARLRDPDSADSDQPEAARSAWRSIDPAWFVAIALGTDYGCPVKPLAENPGGAESGAGPGVDDAAFVDECRGSSYDRAGRVFAGQYADRNLAVPDHSFEGNTLVLGR